MRAGSQALSLLSVPLNVHVLTALADEPRPLTELRRAVGSPPQTTMRGHLRALTELGVLERRRRADFPSSVDYGLTAGGRELLPLSAVVQAWLNRGPDPELLLGTPAAKSTIKALIDGWTSTLLRALAAKPFSLTELDRLITALNYPSLERRLGAMRLAGLIASSKSGARGTPYTVTPWLREAVAPLTAAALWERERLSTAAPLTRIDIEATFLLAVPLVALPAGVSGRCRLAVERFEVGRSESAGALVDIQDGRVESCISRLRGSVDASVSGSAPAWLRAVARDSTESLEIGGDAEMAKLLLDRLHGALHPRARIAAGLGSPLRR